MGDDAVEMLLARCDLLQRDPSFEEWRRLARDVLTALVEQQGVVIALQRRAFEQPRSIEDRIDLRMRAEAAFGIVQRLHQLRSRIHAVLNDRRAAVAYA